MLKLLIIGSLAAPLAAGMAVAQTTAPTPPPPAAHAKERSAASLECSKRADAQNVHGKARKKFMRSCKKELAKKG